MEDQIREVIDCALNRCAHGPGDKCGFGSPGILAEYIEKVETELEAALKEGDCVRVREGGGPEDMLISVAVACVELKEAKDRLTFFEEADKKHREYSSKAHERYRLLRGTLAIHEDREDDQVCRLSKQHAELAVLRPIKDAALALLKQAGAMTYHGLTLKPLIDALWPLHPMGHLKEASVGKQIEALTAMVMEEK